MNRRVAKGIHTVTNFAFWVENPQWHVGNVLADTLLSGVRALPFDIYELLKQAFYDTNRVIAVNGETVVVPNGADKVDKFMFRYPGRMALGAFESRVSGEVSVVTRYLAGVALPTEVGVKPAHIFRRPHTYVDAVAQTQRRIDLDSDVKLDISELSSQPHTKNLDRTAMDLEILLDGTSHLVTDYGYLPDIADNSGNLRRSILDGSVTLIDVMPFYLDGDRLIGGKPPNILAHINDNIAAYQDFVGQFGA